MPSNGLESYCCGEKISECEPQPIDTRGHDHAAICRTSQCGKYDAATDTWQIQTAKGKAGSISYLYSNPNTRCPNDPPMWKVDNGTDEVGSGKDQPQRAADALERQEQEGSTEQDFANR